MQAGFTYSTCEPFTKNKEKIKQKSQNIFIKMNQINLVLNIIWLMEIVKI